MKEDLPLPENFLCLPMEQRWLAIYQALLLL